MAEAKERPHLLLIENDRSIQQLFEFVLDGCNWEVISKENGDAAVKEWKMKNFAGILLDLNLPHVSGFEITRLIRHIERERSLKPTPIVAITGVLSDNDRNQCLESGMNGFITKPIRAEQLCASAARYFFH